eukprot:2530459-Rhodomonas_salina.2
MPPPPKKKIKYKKTHFWYKVFGDCVFFFEFAVYRPTLLLCTVRYGKSTVGVRVCYAKPGTDIGYGTTRDRPPMSSIHQALYASPLPPLPLLSLSPSLLSLSLSPSLPPSLASPQPLLHHCLSCPPSLLFLFPLPSLCDSARAPLRASIRAAEWDENAWEYSRASLVQLSMTSTRPRTMKEYPRACLVQLSMTSTRPRTSTHAHVWYNYD